MPFTKRKAKNSLPGGLWLDFYELSMAQAYFLYRPRQRASFELFIRSARRPFYLASGIDEAVEYALSLRFSAEAISYLRRLKVFRPAFLDFLRSFRFRGSIFGVREGEIVFAYEPLMCVEANIIEAQILESALLNIVNLNTTLATKSLRVVLAAGDKPVYDFSLRRTHGFDASLAAARNAFLAGAKGTSNVLAGFLYGIPVAGTMAHSFVMSFKEEIDSFHAFWRAFPRNTVLLVDTYSIEKGIENVIRLARFLRRERGRVLGVRIDSGDIKKEAYMLRRRLNEAGLSQVLIMASGDMDEYKIKELLEAGAPVDAFGVGTKMGTSADVPFSDVVYKIVEVFSPQLSRLPLMKLSQNKTALPGRKTVGRKFLSSGIMQYDCLEARRQAVEGKPLLRKLVEEGRRVYLPQPLAALRKAVKRKAASLPQYLKNLRPHPAYPVKISRRLQRLGRRKTEAIRRQIARPPALFLDIDTQYDFVSPRGRLYVAGAEKFKVVWRQLTRLARKNAIPILSSLDSHRRGDKEFKEFPPHCIEGSRGEAKIAATLLKNRIILENKHYSFRELLEMKEAYDQIIIRKPTFSIFANPNTAALLDIYLAQEVYVYGLAAEFCVKAALEGLAERRQERIIVIKDAVAAIEDKKAASVFRSLKKKGVSFITAAELRRRLDKP